MANFDQAYSAYYDLLYADKNYDAETDYVHKLVKKFGKKDHIHLFTFFSLIFSLFFFFTLFSGSGFHHSVLKITYSFFCLILLYY